MTIRRFAASINGYGSQCPYALRLVACVLLLEVTAFLRETYQTLPKSNKLLTKERPPPWERMYSREANRRWSVALSSMGQSQASAQSLQSIVGDREVGEYKEICNYLIQMAKVDIGRLENVTRIKSQDEDEIRN